MKKLISLAIIAGFVFTISSCKKDYTCECTYDNAGTSLTTSTPYEKVKKSDAEESCTALQDEYYKVLDPEATCELK